MTLQESSVIYSRHRVRGIFVLLISLCFIIPPAFNLSPHFYPETCEKNITVQFEYDGAFEKDIEKLIDKLEQSLSSLSGLESIYSVSESEKGTVYCSFSEKKDFDEAYMEVRDCVRRVYSLFPENVQRPVFLKSGFNNSPVFASSFNTDTFKDSEELERAFREIKGCSDAETGGELISEIIVIPDAEKIHSSVFNFSSIISRIRSENTSAVVTPPGRKQIKAGVKIKNVRDIEKIYLSDLNKIADYNSIRLRKKEPDSEGRIDGEKRLILYAMKEGESSVIEVCRDFAELTEKLGGDIVFNRGEEIEKALFETALSVSAGIIAVIITALLYFRNISFSLLVILNILFSITASAACLEITHHNLDVITLSGMAVVSGLAIDNSIIFLEKYKRKKCCIGKAVSETIYSLLFSLLTTCIVFVPLIFASLKLKTMFSGMAVSVSSGLLASFLFTFYFVPLFLNRESSISEYKASGNIIDHGIFEIKSLNNNPVNNIYNDKTGTSDKTVISNFINSIKGMLSKIFRKTVKILSFNKFYPVMLLAALTCISCLLFSLTEYSPFSFESRNRLTLLLEFPAGSSFQSLKKTAFSVEKELLDYISEINVDNAESSISPDNRVRSEFHDSSAAQIAGNKENVQDGISLVLKTGKERARFDIKAPDRKYPGLIRLKTDEISLKYPDIYFHYPSSSESVNYYDITIYGRNIENTAYDAYRIGKAIEAKCGNLKTVYHFKQPSEGLKVVFNIDKAFSSSISPDSGAKYIYTLLTSPVIARYYSNGTEQDIRFGSSVFYTPETLKKLTLSGSNSPDNKSVKTLEDIADFVQDSPPGRIYHRNRQRALSMSVTGVGGKKEAAVIERILSEFDFKDGCRGEGGVIYNEKKGERGELLLLISLSFFFIITVLVVQFESCKIPLLITAGIPSSFLLPLSVILVTGMDLNASTALALILSSGICVNNSILVLSPFKCKKIITHEMLISSLSGKTWAILTASFTTILSIFPLIITGPGSILAPFSIVLSSGILGSLLILPVIISSCCTEMKIK